VLSSEGIDKHAGYRGRPMTTSPASMRARTPNPGRTVNSCGSGTTISRAIAAWITARPREYSLSFSAMASRRNRSFSVSSPRDWMVVSFGCPNVSVPVLSKATAVTFAIASKVAPFLTRLPRSAAFPMEARGCQDHHTGTEDDEDGNGTQNIATPPPDQCSQDERGGRIKLGVAVENTLKELR
jgi:hypothetical protein